MSDDSQLFGNGEIVKQAALIEGVPVRVHTVRDPVKGVDELAERLRESHGDQVFHADHFVERMQDLAGEEFTAVDVAYIVWMSTPKRQRVPKTKKELADVLGVSARTLSEKGKDSRITTRIMTYQHSSLVEHQASVMNALVDSATVADYKHAPDRKLYAELVGLRDSDQINVMIRNSQGGGNDLDLPYALLAAIGGYLERGGSMEMLAGVIDGLEVVGNKSPSPQPSPLGEGGRGL